MDRTVEIGKIYKHFKGNLYRVLTIGKYSDTKESLVIYQDIYHNEKIWVRPLKQFMEKVDTDKYPNVDQEYRFELISLKCMISQPMNGISDEEINSTKEKATKIIEGMGYNVVNTLFDEEWANQDNMKKEGIKNIPVYFLAKSLESMSKCDAVYFCNGWQNARGCMLEHAVAKTYGIKIIYES